MHCSSLRRKAMSAESERSAGMAACKSMTPTLYMSKRSGLFSCHSIGERKAATGGGGALGVCATHAHTHGSRTFTRKVVMRIHSHDCDGDLWHAPDVTSSSGPQGTYRTLHQELDHSMRNSQDGASDDTHVATQTLDTLFHQKSGLHKFFDRVTCHCRT